jgi:hypothetical protein
MHRKAVGRPLDSHEIVVAESPELGAIAKEVHMDRILEAQANAVLSDLVNNGGGTYQQGTLLPFSPDKGYAVAIGGVKLPADCATVSMVEWALRQVAREFFTSYVGTWLDEGVVYCDAVVYFANDQFERACAAGREAGQKAIYDFGQKVSVTL